VGIKAKLEYIWLDGYKPTQNLRSKTKVVEDFSGELADVPVWAFDGSSTEQADGSDSDCLLKPVAVYPDPARRDGWLVMTEVLSADNTPHPSNGRATISDQSDDYWFGYEQEYCIWDNETDKPIGFPAEGYPGPQGPYYCSVGAGNAVGRQIVDEHLDLCLDAGLTVEGINAEVMMGQWEFQVFSKGAAKAGDECWLSRYLLERTAEKYGYSINWDPKPVKGDWNGSGMHTNFSNTLLRTCGSQAVYEQVCKAFEPVVAEHMAVYGALNDQRLTGLHETQAMDKFSFGVSDRGASIRIGIATVEAGWKGWLEDRRPASNADPYKVASRIVETLAAVTKQIK
jgi:glutamine synthetase